MACPKGQNLSELTPKQRIFIINYTNPTSPTFGNAFLSYKKAYNCKKSSDKVTMSSACTLLKNPKVSKEIEKIERKTLENQPKKHEISKAYALNCLQETYNQAKTKADTTNQVACVRLMMQYNGLLSERLVIDLDDSLKLERGYQRQAKQIASLIIQNRDLLPPPNSAIPEPSDGFVGNNQQQDTQDIVCSDSSDNAIIDTECVSTDNQ